MNLLFYKQSTGLLFTLTENIGLCYSGFSGFKNNPRYELVTNLGCIPSGLYTVLNPIKHQTLGDLVFPLQPSKFNECQWRNGFYIHGDDGSNNCSRGCIVANHAIRLFTSELKPVYLIVVH